MVQKRNNNQNQINKEPNPLWTICICSWVNTGIELKETSLYST